MYIQEKPYIPFAAAMIFAALPLALLMHELALCAVFGGHRRVRVGVCRLHYRKRGRQRGLGRNARHRRFLLHPERVRTGDVFPAQTAHPRARADGRVLQTEKIRQRPS